KHRAGAPRDLRTEPADPLRTILRENRAVRTLIDSGAEFASMLRHQRLRLPLRQRREIVDLLLTRLAVADAIVAGHQIPIGMASDWNRDAIEIAGLHSNKLILL